VGREVLGGGGGGKDVLGRSTSLKADTWRPLRRMLRKRAVVIC
jgi:hypothetical protein